jgi:flavodoxin
MSAVVIYQSLTGNTRKAAEALATGLTAEGLPTIACKVDAVDYQALHEADLVVVGGWVDGFVMFGQRPGQAGKLRKIPALRGKRAVVFMTYAIDSGKALEKLADLVSAHGAEVVGGVTIRRDRLQQGVAALTDQILDVVTPA